MTEFKQLFCFFFNIFSFFAHSSFEDVTIILFVVALSEYDLLCEEDQTTNRMHESLKLFEDMVNHHLFTTTPFFMFYNKDDLFRDKVREKTKTKKAHCGF